MGKIFCILISPFVLIIPLHPQDVKSVATINNVITVEVKRLSERVLVLTDASPNGIITAISTDEGIIIIDTGVSWSFGKGFRRIIEQEFKCNDFIYVINTHADRDHTFGNQAFKDATIVGHENCYTSLQRMKMGWDEIRDEYISLHTGRAERNMQELKEIPGNSDPANEKRRLVAINNLIASDLSDGQEIIPPTLTFNKQMTLYAGEITLHLYYLGEGHSDCDILIHVPQENLIIVGDAFIKSMLICYLKQDKFDMSTYSEIMNTVLNDSVQIKYAICGHGSIMTAEELLARRDYLNSLSKGIKQGYVNGMNLETIIHRFPLDNYSYLIRLIGNMSPELENQHIEIIEKYWSILNDGGTYEH